MRTPNRQTKNANYSNNHRSNSIKRNKSIYFPGISLIPSTISQFLPSSSSSFCVTSAMDDGAEHQDVPSLDLSRLKVLSPLGRGAKGVVFLVQTTDTQFLALKAISRASIEKDRTSIDSDGSQYRRIFFEQQVLSSFSHPLLPRLRGVIATDKILGYAIDYCPGRDLNSLRNKQTEKMFSDSIIRFYAAELVLALEYLHGLGIVYRDLKPENVLVQESGHLMLVDFDLSVKLSVKSPQTLPIVKSAPKSLPMNKKRRFFRCNSGISPERDLAENDSRSASSSELDSVEKSNSFVGTEEYVAPEIIQGKGHDFAVDWWCLGIVLYEMLYGATPFRGSNRNETFNWILKKSPELVGEPTPLRDLIGKLLEKDPKKRISLERIKGHDFFRGVDWDRILEITRPPHIPLRPEQEEDTQENKIIDVESFVQGVFKIENVVEPNKDSESKKNNTGGRAEGLNQSPSPTEHFNVF
ncbi:Serine/threonine-protein kinase OXI1 [Camellia lanceoleosa]|uniref:Serine/threonine-protein kinase OXI1 n=1 Tax=Camellia lanceoleosa TaxID=1840588 RepID=A0ACC0HSI9_9ERIC|nr:Serine/threonine-protein kinase OXI1 [Camellia lanceoleosa]